MRVVVLETDLKDKSKSWLSFLLHSAQRDFPVSLSMNSACGEFLALVMRNEWNGSLTRFFHFWIPPLLGKVDIEMNGGAVLFYSQTLVEQKVIMNCRDFVDSFLHMMQKWLVKSAESLRCTLVSCLPHPWWACVHVSPSNLLVTSLHAHV